MLACLCGRKDTTSRKLQQSFLFICQRRSKPKQDGTGKVRGEIAVIGKQPRDKKQAITFPFCISLQNKSITMKTIAATLVAGMAGSAMAFAPSSTSQQSSTALKAGMPDRLWDTMVDKTERSKSLPWLPRPAALDGSYVGDVGFDPFYLSSIPKNFAGFIQPPSWEEVKGLDTLYWMREAELKHSRVAMLAVVGWLATDGALGPFALRFPGEIYSTASIPNSYSAHDILVEQGSMKFLLIVIGFLEFCSSAALVQVAKGELDREAGDFGLDPIGFLKGKSKENIDTMKLKEINNGRLAMLAFGGLATQTALGEAFQNPPYFSF